MNIFLIMTAFQILIGFFVLGGYSFAAFLAGVNFFLAGTNFMSSLAYQKRLDKEREEG